MTCCIAICLWMQALQFVALSNVSDQSLRSSWRRKFGQPCYGELNQQSIPIIIASARLSQKSVDGYARFLSLIKTALSGNVSIAAQTPDDRERFLAVGASPEKVLVTGNIKFDFDPPKGIDIIGRVKFRDKHGCGERPVWVAASTHEGEEEQVLAAHAALRLTYPDALLLLVPRHPERFDDVAKLLQQSGVRGCQTQQQSAL